MTTSMRQAVIEAKLNNTTKANRSLQITACKFLNSLLKQTKQIDAQVSELWEIEDITTLTTWWFSPTCSEARLQTPSLEEETLARGRICLGDPSCEITYHKRMAKEWTTIYSRMGPEEKQLSFSRAEIPILLETDLDLNARDCTI